MHLLHSRPPLGSSALSDLIKVLTLLAIVSWV